jgi:hypothetical protein
MLSVYTRHNPDCKYASDKQWRRCNCPKWIWGSLAGKFPRRSAKTHSTNTLIAKKGRLAQNKTKPCFRYYRTIAFSKLQATVKIRKSKCCRPDFTIRRAFPSADAPGLIIIRVARPQAYMLAFEE